MNAPARTLAGRAARAAAARSAGMVALLVSLVSLVLAACGTQPPTPTWQLEASGALERYQQAWLSGEDRLAAAEFRRAREALASTGEPTWVARAELTRCAMQVAALDFAPCAGFDALRADVPAAERAYADYLAGAPLDAERAGLLPPQHRAAALDDSSHAAEALRAIDDPKARLVAAGALLRAGRGSPGVLEVAAETAGAQGWRRPLLAWLGLQARSAEQAGQAGQAQRLRRRMELVTGGMR